MKRNESLGKVGLVLLVVALIVWRRPDFFLEPRFWAEEGKDYFADTWNLGFLQGLFLQHFGYYAIVPSAATALATLVPLEQAPLVTTCIAALFQVLVSSLVIFGDSPWWDTWPKKLLIACGIQLINAPEVWLTTICIQYWMCIAAFLILLERIEAVTAGRRLFLRGMLAVAGLSSVLSLFLTPLFALKAWRSRSREAWVQTGILFTLGALQAVVFVASILARDSHVGGRFGDNQFDLLRVLYWHFFEPFAGGRLDFWTPLTEELVTFAILAYVVAVFIRYLRDPERRLIPLAFCLVTVLSTLLSLKMMSSPRYAFAPSAMLLVMFVNEALAGKNRIWRALGVAVVLLTAVGAYTELRTRFIGGPGWPKWREEVKLWQAGQTDRLLIWPQFRNASWDVEIRRK